MAGKKAMSILPNLPPLPTMKEVMSVQKISALKRLSQNFLMDLNLTNKIVRHAKFVKGAHVCEVGPGPGGITRSILNKQPASFYVIEKDKRFLPGLELLSEASNGKMKIFLGDILRFDMSKLFPDDLKHDWLDIPPMIHIIGNLPFSVATPLIIQWLQEIQEHKGAWSYGRSRLTLTFQLEVAQRMVAEPESLMRSRLSIMCQYLCHVNHVFTIPGKAFTPAPDVDVGVVTFVPRKEPLIGQPFKLVEKVVRCMFQHRQKLIKWGFEMLVPFDRPDLVDRFFKLSGIGEDSRPMELTIDEFKSICCIYEELCNEIPGLFEYDARSREVSEAKKQWRTAKRDGEDVFLGT
ncbi:unnamed protein product [Owenia fusiformis]|uniref:rRNA adenine N(6)-methyltransferase n=1 Tax=Owenia fusiformis TaxID=6347 RepID=A0A8J1TJL4_OWEFU|nr:unnamed protein product [Owenia fusiformis]